MSAAASHVYSPVVLLTGASGFVGSHIRRLLSEPSSAVRLRLLVRGETNSSLSAADDGVEVRLGDLRDPRSLGGAADGVDVLIHCASYVGRSAEAATATNVLGTQALLAEASRAGIRRLVYVSTAGVYGRGPFRNRGGDSLAVAPASTTSRTRAQAERLVLEAGGTALRPHLVYGTGDQWVGPRAIRLGRLLQGKVSGFHALLSMVDVRRLAEATVGLALSQPLGAAPQLYDCNHPIPVLAADCLRALLGAANHPVSAEAIGYDQAYALLRDKAEPTHDLDMLAVDHWFDSTRIWSDLQLDAGPPFLAALSDHWAWYAGFG